MTRLTSYIVGFVLSVVLTFAPIYLLWMHEVGAHAYPSHAVMYISFVAAALLQLLVQLYFFLHLGEERNPRYNLQALCFALIVVVILVGGTLWIMQELKVRGHSEHQPFIHGVVTPQNSND